MGGVTDKIHGKFFLWRLGSTHAIHASAPTRQGTPSSSAERPRVVVSSVLHGFGNALRYTIDAKARKIVRMTSALSASVRLLQLRVLYKPWHEMFARTEDKPRR